MFSSYFKIAWRNLWKNKTFSFINIIGLAVSMSVGLLMIAFIVDLLSHDSFHQKEDQIYRVITESKRTDGTVMALASSSVKTGYQIKEKIPGIEGLTTIRNGFGGDAQVGASTLPIEGLWADSSFLTVFSFPLLLGDASNALKDPYSLVLTETSAKKIFGRTNVLNELLVLDSSNYKVTGVLKDIPKLSHLKFEVLASLSTAEGQALNRNSDFFAWDSYLENYTYLVMPKTMKIEKLQQRLNQLCAEENRAIENQEIALSLQPLDQIMIGNFLANEIGPTFSLTTLWVLIALSLVIILSACFNYTNLSIAGSLQRSREVGVLKVIGAVRHHVAGQFISESVLISLLALIISFPIFLFLRSQLISLDPYITELASLDLSAGLIFRFILLAIGIGLVAGLFPAIFFSKIQPLQVLKGVPSLRLFRRVNMRKSLIVIQYVLSLFFITATIIGYSQYRGFIDFDLGFKTENIVNIKLQGNTADLLVKELSEIPAVSEISQSMIITSLGNQRESIIKYENTVDSLKVVRNTVDHHYLPLHKHEFLAGRNFRQRNENSFQREVIVNEQLIKKFGIGNSNPNNALGQVLNVDGVRAIIVGVLKDFNYQIVRVPIEPFILLYSANPDGYLNVKVNSNNWDSTLGGIETAWKDVDKVHQLEADLYTYQIEQAYRPYSVIIKLIGFLAFMAIFISSMGLFGMVVFTTQTKLKEVSIRKVLGASEEYLVYLLSKNFLFLLILSALIALPLTYFFFDKVILVNFAYHRPIGILELLIGLLGVLIVSVLMIGSQTFKAARTNPTEILQAE